MPELVISETANGVATVTLNRPQQRNAISLELLDALDAAIAAVEQDERVRVMILAGAGPVFCAGMDLEQLVIGQGVGREMIFGLLRELSQVARRIHRLQIPTISCAQGAAIGGGCTLMLVTDFAVTHAEARIGYPPAEMNLSPAVLAPWLIRRIGPGRARAMLLRGGTVSGAEAFQRGLVTDVVEPEAIESTAADLARTVMEAGRDATAVLKGLLNELDGSLDDAALDRAADCSARIVAGEEAQARLRERHNR